MISNNVRFSNNDYDHEIYYCWTGNKENQDVENDLLYGVKVYKKGEMITDIKVIIIIEDDIYG